MDPNPRFDPRDFRQALGRFATGVTIVTTRAADGTPVGMTANSFNSVSMDPPMVLWSLARSARSLPAFAQTRHWNVHILANDQEALSNRFAKAGEDKFTGLTLDNSPNGAPLIPGCSARFQCRTAFQYEGGDHIIFVGEVMDFDRSERAPLVFVTGGYALATRLSGDISTSPQAQTDAAPYSENLLGYLLGRAHYQFMAGFRPTLEARGLSETDFFILSLLAVRSPLTAAEIASHMAYTGVDVGAATLGRLSTRGLLSAGEAGFDLSPQGRDDILHVMAAAKAREAELLDQMGPLEAASLRNLLKRLIAVSDPGLPSLWA
ncbi:MAG: flavin reductase [Betaproteobacteria bacterium]|jgi:3-hydroxy-9,10-secoandrosta-1,3,5(10)-triene-9,17-dione monooxygenase reductase component